MKKLIAFILPLLLGALAFSETLPKVDIDLTRMSPTFVYAQVYNMLIDQDTYEGKTVRMKGKLYVSDTGNDENTYSFSCIIQDATACCAAGLPFELAEKKSYPNDFPPENTIITVQGKYHIYEEDGYTRIALINSVLEEISEN